jgi:hypothetical protein
MRFQVVDMSPAQAANFLIGLCELAAPDKLDTIKPMVEQFIKDAYDQGFKDGATAAPSAAHSNGNRTEGE